MMLRGVALPEAGREGKARRAMKRYRIVSLRKPVIRTAHWGRQGLVICIIALGGLAQGTLVPGWCWLTIEMWPGLYHLKKTNH